MIDLLATSPDTWRDRSTEPPGHPRRAHPAAGGVDHRSRHGPAPTPRAARAPRAGELRPVPQARARLARRRQPGRVALPPRAAARPQAGLRAAGRPQRPGGGRRPRRSTSARRPDRPDRRGRRRVVAEHPGPAGGRRRLHPSAADVPGAADLDDLRPGPAVVGARVHRAHHPQAAAGPGGEREQRRPGHPRHPRRGHDEPVGAVRRPDVDHLGAHRGAVDHRDAAELPRARRTVAAGDRARIPPSPQVPPQGAEGLHQRGRDVLPHQLHPHRDGRGRPDGRGPRARRPPGPGG